MKYALLGDLHSHYKKTKAVLQHIQQLAPDACLIGLGDLYECHIGKKKAASLQQKLPLEQATTYTQKFQKLLTFPSVIGNQEERIALVTGRKEFLRYNDSFCIENATIMHGHQFEWDENFEPTFPRYDTPLLFFGHSHRAAIYINGKRTSITYDTPLDVSTSTYEVNIGAVCETRDWCLYDADHMTITFYQAPKLKKDCTG